MRRTCLIVLVAACTAEPAAMQPPPAPTTRCTALEGKTFASLVQGECGLGSNGPSYCTWHLTFTANDAATTHYEWQHSDVIEPGEVECNGLFVTEVSIPTPYDIAVYNAATMQLVWERVAYAP